DRADVDQPFLATDPDTPMVQVETEEDSENGDDEARVYVRQGEVLVRYEPAACQDLDVGQPECVGRLEAREHEIGLKQEQDGRLGRLVCMLNLQNEHGIERIGRLRDGSQGRIHGEVGQIVDYGDIRIFAYPVFCCRV